jgi:hypothetical protein
LPAAGVAVAADDIGVIDGPVTAAVAQLIVEGIAEAASGGYPGRCAGDDTAAGAGGVITLTADGSWLPVYETPNGVALMLNLVDRVFKTLPAGFKILGFGITQASALAAAEKFQQGLTNAEKSGLWCYQTWNGDISRFVDEEDL